MRKYFSCPTLFVPHYIGDNFRRVTFASPWSHSSSMLHSFTNTAHRGTARAYAFHDQSKNDPFGIGTSVGPVCVGSARFVDPVGSVAFVDPPVGSVSFVDPPPRAPSPASDPSAPSRRSAGGTPRTPVPPAAREAAAEISGARVRPGLYGDAVLDLAPHPVPREINRREFGRWRRGRGLNQLEDTKAGGENAEGGAASRAR